MSDIITENRAGFTIYTITLESGEVLKYPALNSDDFGNLTAGFLDDFNTIGKEYQAADTDGLKATVGTALHWLLVKEALTVAEVKKWRALTQLKFYTALNIGGELSGTTAKK